MPHLAGFASSFRALAFLLALLLVLISVADLEIELVPVIVEIDGLSTRLAFARNLESLYMKWKGTTMSSQIVQKLKVKM